MTHTVKDKAKLLARVRRLKGQAAALEKQLDSGDDCAAILQQIAAIRGAVNGLMAAVMEGHLVDHLVMEPDEDKRRQELEVVLQVVKSYLK
ncbi:metal/formaldehyde-sensitive transcriptional repressor [Chromobacterium sp. IIBBL 290-4]|uniref:metal/formaldehyde-sensitive transcriptional repressor n=1 Tax=Chromobacterium sp. IIBBL 290-4 TaxID=2953890 RepID=UPI0020B7492E|nr:metal/formaldehyde-sensitive transcriptional repressor [Chromobacterium sp. IIBBL 290-4]UTH72806.1 metal/formaldehyde-sensitive transcriptional repressor [Chromobacterium sp. IIBBL 290-4]